MIWFRINRSKKSNQLIKNTKETKTIFLDIVLFVADLLIITVLLFSIFFKVYKPIVLNDDAILEMLLLELFQLFVFLIVLIISLIYCHKKQENKKIISRSLFVANVMFNAIFMLYFDLIFNLEFKVNYNQIINSMINLIVFTIIFIYSTVTHIKINKENRKIIKEN
jgi:hypothetical protein